MPLVSNFAKRAGVLADAIVALARASSTDVDERTVSETLENSKCLDAPLDSDEPVSASDCARVEHAHHVAVTTIVRDARKLGTSVTRCGIEDAVEREAKSGELRATGTRASETLRALEHALRCGELLGGNAYSCVFTTIEITLDACALDEAADVVAWMETNRERLHEPEAWRKGKLPTLRTLIALIKRCGGRSARESRLKGRALGLQTWMMGVSDRSGLNLQGASNPNVTPIFEQDEWVREDGENDDETMDVDGEYEKGEIDTSTFGADGAFHKTFWSLQTYYQNPTQAMCRDGAWNTYYAILREIMNKFEEHPLTETAKTLLDFHENPELRDLIGHRFLTARRLLPMQLRDYSFRRQILIQTAFFLEAMTTEKFKEHVVDEEVIEARERVMEILKRTGPDAQLAASFIEDVLEDEAGWRKWRDDGCPNFVREPIDFEKEPMPDNWDIKYSMWPPDQFPEPDPRYKEDFGDEALNRLWNIDDDDVENARSEFLVAESIEDFFRPCLEEMDPEAQVEEQYRRVNDEVFRWRAMRMLARSHLHLFPKIAAEGLESVVPEILGVPDPRPRKETDEAKETTPTKEGEENFLTSHVEALDGELEPIEGDEEDVKLTEKEDVKLTEKEDVMDVGEDTLKIEVNSEVKTEMKTEVKTEVKTEEKKEEPTNSESPAKMRTPERSPGTDSKTPKESLPENRPSLDAGGRGRGGLGGRGGRGGRSGRGRGRDQGHSTRQPVRAVRPPPRQSEPQPPPRRRELSREPQRPPPQRGPPPSRGRDQHREPPGRYTPPHRPQGQRWERGGRDQQSGEPRRDPPPPRHQGTNLGKRTREDNNGGQGGGPRARGNQNQRYNRTRR